MKTAIIFLVAALLAACLANAGETIVLGSKKFTESFVLAEIAKRSLEEAGLPVEHRQGMGGTIILWEALRQGSIPAALLALVAQGLFSLLDRFVIPRGLRIRPA